MAATLYKLSYILRILEAVAAEMDFLVESELDLRNSCNHNRVLDNQHLGCNPDILGRMF